MKILSIDSGLARTGYAIFKKNGQSNILIESGCVITNATELLPKRLNNLRTHMSGIFKKASPDVIVLETIFFGTNQKTLVSIAQAQGVLIELAESFKIPVKFLTPLTVKETITGYGRSDKKSVAKMVKLLLKLKKTIKYDDEIDAIACGLAYCTIKKFNELNANR